MVEKSPKKHSWCLAISVNLPCIPYESLRNFLTEAKRWSVQTIVSTNQDKFNLRPVVEGGSWNNRNKPGNSTSAAKLHKRDVTVNKTKRAIAILIRSTLIIISELHAIFRNAPCFAGKIMVLHWVQYI